MPLIPKRRNRYTLPPAAVLGAGLAFLWPTNTRLAQTLNQTFPSKLDSRVVVVGIDDASLRDYGRLEVWPRELYAQAIRTLNEAGAGAIGVDVLLSDASSNTNSNTNSDTALAPVFSQPNLILATAPGDATNQVRPGWKSPTGVSALNSVGTFQTAYPLDDSRSLVPSFARQVAVQLQPNLPLDTTPRELRYTRPEAMQANTISFRDVVNGNVRFGDLQGRAVLLGLTASGISGLSLPDLDGRPTPGVYLQARAVSSLLGPPIQHLPWWASVMFTVLAAVGAVWLGNLWGFALAAGAILLSGVLWLLDILFPGVTVSLAAVLGAGLVSLERWWFLRTLGTRDLLTGLGNRLAFTRAVESRWQNRQERPISLLLIDLSGFRQITEVHGRLAGEELLSELAGQLSRLKRRGDVVFRWGPEEFAVLLDNTSSRELTGVMQHFQQSLQNLLYRSQTLEANVGAATTGPDIQTPSDLIEAASRERYRQKYQREQQDKRGDG